ncbi:hypothetical protein VOLCADRAFT_80447 [Volvox carteri f. nagariensis]|uniref:CAAX prenyl protease 2/Lysostaphin resistance protein A-like domain-containing protein n=1 Tax=Volvox carteri f. nagariensis TaxID=3068 RepID=D8TRC0_VOLCA|nr:uncharacterized protein VOLCADRAFT_80447 [Volvox carteri f. nagariensis]EFJ49865.1 hypothetical protein VOLCADRAFT_80447 [Volvox carteri f. nagariensis]|eukprot:XP_002948930.1 hypothetical protein VOLCADRAFT_80447 [Volvox carteri f. nagariensis]
MSSSLHQLRLASCRECSTSYIHVLRPSNRCHLVVGRRDFQHQRLHRAKVAGNDAAAVYPPSDEGAGSLGPSTRDHPDPALRESLGRECSGQPAKQPSANISQEGLPKVPWGLGKVFQVMTLWLLAYIIIGHVIVPLILSCLGVDRLELTVRSHAVLHLCLDLSQLIITLSILWSCLREFRPLSLGLFPVRLRGLWPLAVVLCCASFPLVDWLAHQSMGWFPFEPDASWASNLEHSLSVGDWVTNVVYFSVVSLCAPIWEEAIFRGFLLTSLARYMPTPAAVAVSSVVFASCHFRMQTFLPLLVLGVVFSGVFIRTKNLIPPILLHSAWNMYVLVTLVLRPG